jgi:hypothetical protein
VRETSGLLQSRPWYGLQLFESSPEGTVLSETGKSLLRHTAKLQN